MALVASCSVLRSTAASQVPRPPRKDFYKLMSRDRIVLRFAVRLVETPGYPLSKTDRLTLTFAVMKQALHDLGSLSFLLRYTSRPRVWGCWLLLFVSAWNATTL